MSVNYEKERAFIWGSADAAAEIYDHSYAKKYERLYLWPQKHQVNIATLKGALERIKNPAPAWLDTCCGQAWHFSQFPNTIEKVGVDISKYQLARAAWRNTDATFIQSDVLSADLSANRFDLVTNFWGAYCYLDSFSRIERFLSNLLRWTAPGGYIYLEIIVPEYLEDFNDCSYSLQKGFKVFNRKDDFVHWGYTDSGGTHLMTSPPVSFFTDFLSPHFEDIEIDASMVFVNHLVAARKK